MPSISSDLRMVTMSDTSYAEKADRTGPSYRVLQEPVPANDNLPPQLTSTFAEKNLAIRGDPSDVAEDSTMILAFALAAVLILIAWVYAFSLPATVKIDQPAKSGLAFNFRAVPGQ